MKVVIKNNSLPVGVYHASFEEIEESSHKDYGPGWKWVFAIRGGKHDGTLCYRTTKDKPTPNNSCGRFLAALSGTEPTDGFSTDPDDFLGKIYIVTIESSPSGESTRIGSFVPAGDSPF